jgi:hypothetical protein
MTTAVVVRNQKRETSLTTVLDFKEELLTPSLVIYNG